MKRPLRPEDDRLWALVTATVRPAAGRSVMSPPAAALAPDPGMPIAPSEPPVPAAKAPPRFSGRPKPKGPSPRVKTAEPAPSPGLERIEPNRKRRIARERDPLDRRLDLHGLDQVAARASLFAFLHRAQADGVRAVLIITGKGLQGDGVLRRRTPEWLAELSLRGLVAGVSPADRHHGGDGALYVALKRKKS